MQIDWTVERPVTMPCTDQQGVELNAEAVPCIDHPMGNGELGLDGGGRGRCHAKVGASERGPIIPHT